MSSTAGNRRNLDKMMVQSTKSLHRCNMLNRVLTVQIAWYTAYVYRFKI